jgi:uncharacterized SAM-binding protein YcdF (DUF218 family)
MGLFLSKLLPLLIYPLSVAIWLAIIASLFIWRGHRKLAGTSLFLAIAILWISSMPLVAEQLFASLERQYLPVAVQDSPAADAIVVIGGAVGTAVPPRLTIDLGSAADRLLHAARLHRAGKAQFIFAIGGSIPWLGPEEPESLAMVELLQEWGVPQDAIMIGTASLNTHENALETKRLLQEHGLNRILLVTSAAHMPRALATFRTAGVDAIASPTDFEIVDRAQRTILDWLPAAAALRQTTMAIKEHLGYLVYKWRGWIKE